MNGYGILQEVRIIFPPLRDRVLFILERPFPAADK